MKRREIVALLNDILNDAQGKLTEFQHPDSAYYYYQGVRDAALKALALLQAK